MHTDLKTWPQMLPFRQPIPAGHSSRYFMLPLFVSMIIHAFLVYLLLGVGIDHMAVEPTLPPIGTAITVLLVPSSTLDSASQDESEREVVSEMPKANLPAQRLQSFPERPRSAEYKVEAKSVAPSNAQGTSGSETPEDKSLTADAIPSFDPESADRIAREVGRVPQSKAETVATLKGRGGTDSEAAGGESSVSDASPSFDLEGALRIAREVGREWEEMSALTAPSPRFTLRKRYLKNHLGITRKPRPDCRTAYAGGGFLAIPALLYDAITDSGCEWKKQDVRKRQGGRDRKAGKELWWDQTNQSIFGEAAYPVDSSGKLSY